MPYPHHQAPLIYMLLTWLIPLIVLHPDSTVNLLFFLSLVAFYLLVWYGTVCRCLPEPKVPRLYFFSFCTSSSSEGTTTFKRQSLVLPHRQSLESMLPSPLDLVRWRQRTLWCNNHMTPNKELRNSPLGRGCELQTNLHAQVLGLVY